MLVISDRELDLGPVLVGFADFGLRVVGRIGDLSFFFFLFTSIMNMEPRSRWFLLRKHVSELLREVSNFQFFWFLLLISVKSLVFFLPRVSYWPNL